MTVSLALELLLNLLVEGQRISALIAQAQSDGRKDLTAAEMAAIRDAANTAERRLAEAIEKSRT